MADHTPTTATPPGRVLVVDDEQPLAQMVASYLIRAGFDTRQAHTGTQAVDETRRFSPDVVVLDLGLPYDVDHPDGQIREVGAQKVHGGEGLHGGNVPGTTKHHIRFRVRVCAGPAPDADALGAVNDGVVHV